MTDTPTTSFGLMQTAVAVLKAAGTAVGERVYSPGDWPTWDQVYPYLRCRVTGDDKQSLGRNAPQFTVTGTIQVTMVVAALAQLDDAGADAADVALWTLQRQVEVALINAGELMSQLQQYPFVRTRDHYDSSGAQHFGTLILELGVEFYQGPADFCPVPTDDLEQLTVTADLGNIFDPTGTFANPPFPASVQPAPRTAGPDGRSEAALSFAADDDGGLVPGAAD